MIKAIQPSEKVMTQPMKNFKSSSSKPQEVSIAKKSQTEAAKWAGLKCSSGISACCLKKRKTSGGYHWKFVGD